MVFLPGDHTLDTNITVANVTRLTMRGESSSGKIATVVCSGSVGLSFIMAYGSTPYVGMTPKKNGGYIKNAQMTRSKFAR